MSTLIAIANHADIPTIIAARRENPKEGAIGLTLVVMIATIATNGEGLIAPEIHTDADMHKWIWKLKRKWSRSLKMTLPLA